jgi:hypothetical protein
MTSRLKARIVEPEDMSIARQRLGKQVSSATDTQARIEVFLGTVFSFGPCKTVIIKSSVENRQYRYFDFSWSEAPCRGGVEYLHHDPASRRRRRKVSNLRQ